MRSDGLLPYEFEEEPTKTRLIAYAGLLPYLDPVRRGVRLAEMRRKIGVLALCRA